MWCDVMRCDKELMSPLPCVHSEEAGPQPAATVTVYPDGPLVVRGSFEVRQVDGTELPTGRTVALCRCGRSALKPLCAGSHKNGVIQSTSGPAARESKED
jgi:CDGSH-type Zn-finger protein